jgi:hypothetical protein
MECGPYLWAHRDCCDLAAKLFPFWFRVDVASQHPVGCSCGSPECPEWIDSQEVCE